MQLHPIRVPYADRFWAKVDTSGTCWLWLATRDRAGYGAFALNGRMQKAHRVAWELTHGRIPEGLDILHSCDQPRCVRPDHLRPGTAQENMREMVTRGRYRPHRNTTTRGANHWTHRRPDLVPRGATASNARATATQVRAIRELFASGASLTLLADVSGLSLTTVHKIVRRKTWTALPPGPAEQRRAPSLTIRGRVPAQVTMTPEIVRTIRSLRATGESMGHIAMRYGIHPNTVRQIVRRETWKHVE